MTRTRVKIPNVVDLANVRQKQLTAAAEKSTLRCPECSKHTVVCIDSRSTDEGATIRRRRACRECDNRWWTFETNKEPIPPPNVPEEFIHLFGLANDADKTTLLALARHLVKASL